MVVVTVPQGFVGHAMMGADLEAGVDKVADCFFPFFGEADLEADSGFVRGPTDFVGEALLHLRSGCLRGDRDFRSVDGFDLAMMSRVGSMTLKWVDSCKVFCMLVDLSNTVYYSLRIAAWLLRETYSVEIYRTTRQPQRNS